VANDNLGDLIFNVEDQPFGIQLRIVNVEIDSRQDSSYFVLGQFGGIASEMETTDPHCSGR
jgi:hypothetical protein